MLVKLVQSDQNLSDGSGSKKKTIHRTAVFVTNGRDDAPIALRGLASFSTSMRGAQGLRPQLQSFRRTIHAELPVFEVIPSLE